MLFVLVPIGAFAFVFCGLKAIAEIRSGGGNGDNWAFISAAGFALMVSMLAIALGH